MSQEPVRLKLTGPTGESHFWTIKFGPLPKGAWGLCDWKNRVITISTRLRNRKRIQLTLLHEIGHVTSGQNASEEFVENLEENYDLATKALNLE